MRCVQNDECKLGQRINKEVRSQSAYPNSSADNENNDNYDTDIIGNVGIT